MKNNTSRFSFNAVGDPVLICGLELSKRQADKLLEWYEIEEQRMKANKWQEWHPGMMALRTICVQIEAYGGKAFTQQQPGLF